MQLLDGKVVSASIKNDLKIKTEALVNAGKKQPHLAAIFVGNSGASETYVANKIKSCKEIGFKSTLKRFDDAVTEQQVLDTISTLNNDEDVDGILVQLPLPKHIDQEKIIQQIIFP